MNEPSFDAVVVGAGTAGLAAAYHMAARGMRVALLDAQPFAFTGARWVNGVAPWMFDESGIPRPVSPELRLSGTRVFMHDYEWHRTMVLNDNPLWNVDMRALVARLHEMVAQAGVVGFEQTVVEQVELSGGRPVALTATRPVSGGQESLTIQARLFVDATGLGARLRAKVPALRDICPRVHADHLCIARQQVRSISDPDAAREFLSHMGVNSRDIISLVGVEGGFSTLCLALDIREREVEILAGSIADGKHRDGEGIYHLFLDQESWIGEPVFGGQSLIPLRRPYDRFVAPGIALIGNAACQVFPAHGSGIGPGMIAGRILAEAVAGRSDPGSLETLWGYQSKFMRTQGAVHAAYDVFRRLTQAMTSEEIRDLLRSGLMQKSASIAAFEQRMPVITANELMRTILAGLRNPALSVFFLPTVFKLNRVYRHYRKFPETPDPAAHRRWAEKAAKLFGDKPDEDAAA